MPNLTWGILQQTWSDGIGALFGTNLLAIGGFFMIFAIFIASRYGLPFEIILPFAGLMIFILGVANAGLLPLWAWAAFLIVGSIFVFIALKRILGGF